MRSLSVPGIILATHSSNEWSSQFETLSDAVLDKIYQHRLSQTATCSLHAPAWFTDSIEGVWS